MKASDQWSVCYFFGEHLAVCDLRANFHPKALCVRVVKVDDFNEEDNDSGTPEHCTNQSDVWVR